MTTLPYLQELKALNTDMTLRKQKARAICEKIDYLRALMKV